MTTPAPPSNPKRLRPDPAAPAGVQPSDLPMPHERDQTTDAGSPPRDKMRQAGQDLADGQVDTDLRVTPGLDAARRDKLVPGR